MSGNSLGPGHSGERRESRIGAAERDVVALGIAAAAIILFVGTGGAVVPQVVRSLAGYGLGPDKVLVNALVLNIALIIFGWRRYRQLLNEVEERRKAEEQARILAETDSLTGCLNRRSINVAANEMLIAMGSRSQRLAFMMIDLDNFKRVNDFNGHSAGDQVLQQCAKRITELLPEHSLIARIGGDEFAIVVPFEKSRSRAIDQLAAAIVMSISNVLEINGVSVEVTASLGISDNDMGRHDDGSPADAQTLLHMADIAMYQAKKQGRNHFLWFEEPMESELRFRGEIETGIRRGIPLGEFVPYYQQQIDLQTGELTGFEMLARWNSPTLGLVKPDIFIPVAEAIGAIGELSESVISQALADAKDWDPHLTLAVNISPLQLRDPWFAQKLLRLLTEANFPPQRLEIEITESCLHENIGVARTLITSLQNQGIRVSLDDFGTGYSSIAQLRSLPFDRIKIDRSFVTNLIENQDSAAIVHSIALLGQGLGMPITAEGIETGEVMEQLRQYGEMKGQGFLYGQPQPATIVHEWLADHDLLEKEEAIAAESIETGAIATEAGPDDLADAPRQAGNA